MWRGWSPRLEITTLSHPRRCLAHMADPTIHELFDLSDRVALVTGGAGFLGSAIAEALAEAGARVVISSRDPERATVAARQLPNDGTVEHLGIELDHKDENSVRSALELLADQVGPVDVLFNNGQGGTGADWTEIDSVQFSDQLENATGYFLLSRLVHAQAVERQQPASIILLGSMYGMVGSYPDAYEGVCSASSVAYQTLKGGVIQMTRHLAVYWARDGVRVNCLSPGPFPASKAPGEMVERLRKKSPLGRMGQPFELKGAALFLASDASSYVTGQNLVVDGGWTAW